MSVLAALSAGGVPFAAAPGQDAPRAAESEYGQANLPRSEDRPGWVGMGAEKSVVPASPAGGAGEDSKPVSPATNGSPAIATEPGAKPPAGQPQAKKVKPAAGEAASPEKSPPAKPTLDLASLEKRLKETSAIGVFTKLTLKNQVDDLLGQFRAYYQGTLKTTLTDLRQPYDLLILKVMTLLQDEDPSLAAAVRESREAIWGILTDRDKFSKVQA